MKNVSQLFLDRYVKYENQDIFILLWIKSTLSFCDLCYFTHEISY